jgi:hypothetical protein
VPAKVAVVRATLAEWSVAAERGLWTLAKLDNQMAAATATLASRRQELDRTRTRLASAQVTVDRLKSAARLIMRAIELRRAFL